MSASPGTSGKLPFVAAGACALPALFAIGAAAPWPEQWWLEYPARMTAVAFLLALLAMSRTSALAALGLVFAGTTAVFVVWHVAARLLPGLPDAYSCADVKHSGSVFGPGAVGVAYGVLAACAVSRIRRGAVVAGAWLALAGGGAAVVAGLAKDWFPLDNLLDEHSIHIASDMWCDSRWLALALSLATTALGVGWSISAARPRPPPS